MKEKLYIEDLANMLYSQKRQAEIAGVTPSTFNIAVQNIEWPSTEHKMKAIQEEISRELTHSQNSTSYPEHRAWVKATLKYMKTMGLFDPDD